MQKEYERQGSSLVILCGSLISMMESQTLAYSSPLYGRRTAQIRLKQIPFQYYHDILEREVPVTEENLILGECKYWQEPVGMNILAELEEKKDRVAWKKKSRHVWYVLFSLSGFSEELLEFAKEREDLVLLGEAEDE